MYEPTFDPRAVLARVRELPGGRELIDLARGREDVELVGGAVRDLMLGRDPRELDVVVGGETSSFADAARLFASAARFARELAVRLSALTETNEHERFGTARVEWDGGRIDVATRRAESYAAPGALPDVRVGTPQEDLLRRDFTVNALAVALDRGQSLGEDSFSSLFRAAPGALEDLRGRRLRVLHDASFLDDPTRLLRLARYAARLGFEIEPHTAELAAAAVAQGALDTVSGARIGAELRLALNEPDVIAALAAMQALGLFTALHPRLRFDERLARTALDLLSVAEVKPDSEEARPDRLLLAVLLQPMALGLEDGVEDALVALLERLEFPAADSGLALHAAICADAVAEELEHAELSSQLYRAASHISLEGIALAGAWGKLELGVLSGAAIGALRWLTELHNIGLLITGDDLLAAGVPQGPEIGLRLEAALLEKLDDELACSGRDAELAAALRART